MSDGPELNLKPIEQLLKAMKLSGTVQCGILGRGKRSDGKTNALIGAVHEFGSATVPQRSWLRVPLADHFTKYLRKSGLLDKVVLAQVLKTGTVKPWLDKCAVVAERVVQDGFSTGGFGKWVGWSAGYTNNTGQILVDSQQLRNSVTTKVKVG